MRKNQRRESIRERTKENQAAREKKQLKKKHAVSSGRKTRSRRNSASEKMELMMSLLLYIC